MMQQPKLWQVTAQIVQHSCPRGQVDIPPGSRYNPSKNQSIQKWVKPSGFHAVWGIRLLNQVQPRNLLPFPQFNWKQDQNNNQISNETSNWSIDFHLNVLIHHHLAWMISKGSFQCPHTLSWVADTPKPQSFHEETIRCWTCEVAMQVRKCCVVIKEDWCFLKVINFSTDMQVSIWNSLLVMSISMHAIFDHCILMPFLLLELSRQLLKANSQS